MRTTVMITGQLMSGTLKEIEVPCPKCGRLHRVSVEEARMKAHIALPCGAAIGSAGVLRRADIMEEKVERAKDRIYSLK
jgi:energy-converting hydrogenase Eha subunit H